MKTQFVDTNPKIEEIQISLLRKASSSKKLSLVRSLSKTVILLSRRAIARANPQLDEEQIRFLFIELQYGKNLADRFKKDWEAKKHAVKS